MFAAVCAFLSAAAIRCGVFCIVLTLVKTPGAPLRFILQKGSNGSTDRSIEASAFANGTEVIAYYRPIVNEIDVAPAKAPAGGEALPGMVSTTVTITDTRKINNAILIWNNAAIRRDVIPCG